MAYYGFHILYRNIHSSDTGSHQLIVAVSPPKFPHEIFLFDLFQNYG